MSKFTKQLKKAFLVGLFIYLISILFFSSAVFAYVMESSNYKLERDSINIGGAEDGSSTNYQLRDTIGEIGSGGSGSGSYGVQAGYRQTDTVTTPICGDGNIDAGETCDSNTQSCITGGYAGSQSCNAACDGWNACAASEFCGDGAVNGSEVCDDGNNASCDGCRTNCARADNVCGDGYLDTDCGEVCDGSLGATAGYTCGGCQLQAAGESALGSGALQTIDIANITRQAGINEALIGWTTNKDALCRLDWGKTQELKDGAIEDMAPARQHEVRLINLQPETNYYFQIFCSDDYGGKNNSAIETFWTKEKIERIPPLNAQEFSSEVKDGKVILKWINPGGEDFAGVKIIRSKEFYPQSIEDGLEIYDGNEEYFIDENILPDTRYYYTIFTYDNYGNYSSGAITSVIIYKTKTGEGEDFLPLPAGPLIPPEEMMQIGLSDFIFKISNGTIRLKSDNESLALLPGTILNVSTDKNNYPKVLKSIIITIVPGQDKGAEDKKQPEEARSYLLRADQGGEVYSATLTAPTKASNYDLYFSILNYQYSKIAKTEGYMEIKKFGKIISPKFGNLFVKAVGASENDLGNPVYGAVITLYNFENGVAKRWAGEKYSQFNPLLSNQYGQYGFLAPNGRYIIKAERDNYYEYTSLPFTVSNNLVYEDIELIYKPKAALNLFFWLLLILALIIFYYFRKRTRKRDKEIMAAA